MDKKSPEEISAIKKIAKAYIKLKRQYLDNEIMKPEDILKKALNTPPPKGNEDDITPPIQIYILKNEMVVKELELSNKQLLEILTANSDVAYWTSCKIIIDDGKNSYTFSLDKNEFTPNKLEKKGKPMK